jgi:uncharacterized phage protein gp47/JayE
MAGLTSTGFQRKTLAEIKSEIEETLRSTLGRGINLNPPSVFATLVGSLSEQFSQVWELSEAIYYSQYPDTATGVSLDNVVALIGLTRLEATKSVSQKQLFFGTIGTVIPAGTLVSVAGNPQGIFELDTAVTLVAGADEVQRVDFSAVPTSGSFALKYFDQETTLLGFGSTASNVQVALQALTGLTDVTVAGSFAAGFTVTFGGLDGKQNQPTLLVTQNTLLNGIATITTSVVILTEGVPQGQGIMVSQATGVLNAPRGSLTEIGTLVAGLNRTLNEEDVVSGRAIETDNELRIRRGNSLQVAGAGTVDAIRSRLSAIEGVTAALVFENTLLVTDIDGRPAKSFEAVVEGGAAIDITQTVWDTKPAGIQTFGNTSGLATDTLGESHTVYWSRPTVVDIYLDVTITANYLFPVDGATQVENALIAAINALLIGEDVIVIPKLTCAIGSIPGILGAVIKIGTAPAPTLSNNITIAAQEIARTDSTKVSVTIV